MYNNEVWVSEHMVSKFTEMVKPQGKFTVERFKSQVTFSFTDKDDLARAESINGTLLLGNIDA